MCGKSIKNEGIKPESDSCESCSISRHTSGQKEKDAQYTAKWKQMKSLENHVSSPERKYGARLTSHIAYTPVLQVIFGLSTRSSNQDSRYCMF